MDFNEHVWVEVNLPFEALDNKTKDVVYGMMQVKQAFYLAAICFLFG